MNNIWHRNETTTVFCQVQFLFGLNTNRFLKRSLIKSWKAPCWVGCLERQFVSSSHNISQVNVLIPFTKWAQFWGGLLHDTCFSICVPKSLVAYDDILQVFPTDFAFHRRINMGEYETLLYSSFMPPTLIHFEIWCIIRLKETCSSPRRCQWQPLYYMEKGSMAFWYCYQGLILQQSLSQKLSFPMVTKYSFKLWNLMHRSCCRKYLNVSFLIAFFKLCKEICGAREGSDHRFKKILAD